MNLQHLTRGIDREKPTVPAEKPLVRGNPLSFARLAVMFKSVAARMRSKASRAPAKATPKPSRPVARPSASDSNLSTARTSPAPDDELHDGSAAVLAARRRERQRCEAIVTSEAGMLHPAMARKLAFESRTSRSEALMLLEAQPAASGPMAFTAEQSAARAARNPKLGAGLPEGAPPPKRAGIPGSWDRAFAAASVSMRTAVTADTAQLSTGGKVSTSTARAAR